MRIQCPICKTVLADAPEDFPSRPFCSPRCKLADLHHWLTEGYRISTPLQLEDESGDERDIVN